MAHTPTLELWSIDNRKQKTLGAYILANLLLSSDINNTTKGVK